MKLMLLLKLVTGFVALLLGGIGLLLPVWPTTPFVLLSLYCFSQTPWIRERILRIRFFREYYEGYTQKRGLRGHTVAVSLIFLWGMLLLSCLIVWQILPTLLLIGVGLAVTAHILQIARARHPAKGDVKSS